MHNGDAVFLKPVLLVGRITMAPSMRTHTLEVSPRGNTQRPGLHVTPRIVNRTPVGSCQRRLKSDPFLLIEN